MKVVGGSTASLFVSGEDLAAKTGDSFIEISALVRDLLTKNLFAIFLGDENPVGIVKINSSTKALDRICDATPIVKAVATATDRTPTMSSSLLSARRSMRPATSSRSIATTVSS